MRENGNGNKTNPLGRLTLSQHTKKHTQKWAKLKRSTPGSPDGNVNLGCGKRALMPLHAKTLRWNRVAQFKVATISPNFFLPGQGEALSPWRKEQSTGERLPLLEILKIINKTYNNDALTKRANEFKCTGKDET